MKLLKLLILSFLPASPALAELADWQKCLDLPEFKLVDNLKFISISSASKKGCEFRIIHADAVSRVYEFDVCNEDISLKVYPSLQESTYKFYRASSANCALPMFGADFDANPEHVKPYEEAKDTIFKVLASLDKAHNTKENAKIKAGQDLIEQVNCVRKLVSEYLLNCVSFEGPPEAKKTPYIRKEFDAPLKESDSKNLPQGVHPAIIQK